VCEATRSRRDEQRGRTRADLLDDLGVSEELLPSADAPRILVAAADGLTQAALADEEVAADGGRLLARTLQALVRDARTRTR
jgi:hypothetical protein